MSGQWEVVGRKKEKHNKNQALKSNKEQKDVRKPAEVKIEEILSKAQVQNLYNNKIKENKQPKEKVKSQETKKPQKKNDKPQEVAKPKPPKSIESALKSIETNEFRNIFEKIKNHYPDGPIVWLKELVQYLNQKLALDVADAVFSSKPLDYPYVEVPVDIKAVIEKSIKEAGKSNVQLFFDIALTSMATDMGKGSSALGWKLFLQYIALNEPKLIVSNINKHVILRNSYQNRSNIGLSILWAVGQVGQSDFRSGLTVFQELFLPLIEMKSYTNYIMKYLSNLLHSKNITLSKEEYVLILENVYASRKNIDTEVQNELLAQVWNLRLVMCKSDKEKYTSYIEYLLKKMPLSGHEFHQKSICHVLTECLRNDKTCFASWKKVYSKNIAASAKLLAFINNNLKIYKLDQKLLTELLDSFRETNLELNNKKKKDEGLSESVKIIQELSENMKKKSQSSVSFRTLLILLNCALAAAIYCDVRHGWESSTTKNLLKETGVCEYTTKGLNAVNAYLDHLFPNYKKIVSDHADPYVHLIKDMWLLFCNLRENTVYYWNLFGDEMIEEVEKVTPEVLVKICKFVASRFRELLAYIDQGYNYLIDDVFVGPLSPENMQKVVIDAFNTTQQKATEYYFWLYEKVQTTIK